MPQKLLLIFLLFNCVCFSQNTSKSTDTEIEKAIANLTKHISIITLISNPEKYHEKNVQIRGYLNLEFEGNAIYVHKEDYKKGLVNNGLWVSFNKETLGKIRKKKINKTYVIIKGKFDKNDTGHMGLFSGSINGISRVDKLK